MLTAKEGGSRLWQAHPLRTTQASFLAVPTTRPRNPEVLIVITLPCSIVVTSTGGHNLGNWRR